MNRLRPFRNDELMLEYWNIYIVCRGFCFNFIMLMYTLMTHVDCTTLDFPLSIHRAKGNAYAFQLEPDKILKENRKTFSSFCLDVSTFSVCSG